MKKKILGLLILVSVCLVAAFATACGGSADTNAPDAVTPEHTHTYGEWTVTTAATCTTDGLRTRACSGCDEVERETIEKLGHKYSTTWTTDGAEHWHVCENTGCTEMGNKAAHADSYDCAVCGHYVPTEGLVFTGYKLEGETPTVTEVESEIEYYAVSGIGTATDTYIRIPLTYKDKPVTEIGENAFNNNDEVVTALDAITAITMRENITLIGARAFRYCENLVSVVIGEGVESLGDYVFYNCSALTTVTIGSGVKYIGRFAFRDSGHIETVNYMGDLASWCAIEFGPSSSPLTYSNADVYMNGKLMSTGELVIPGSIVSISDDAFSDWEKLTKVTIEEGVQSIGGGAFVRCSLLKSVIIPNSVQSIGDYAFSSCSLLESVTFENTTGWFTTSDEAAVSGTNIDVTTPATNATNLSSVYANLYWKRTA